MLKIIGRTSGTIILSFNFCFCLPGGVSDLPADTVIVAVHLPPEAGENTVYRLLGQAAAAAVLGAMKARS